MSRKFLLVLIVTLLAATGFARRGGDSGVTLGDPQFALLADLSSGPKPTALLRADEVVYRVGDPITLTLDMNPNGHLFGKTFFLYLQNMRTGEIRYLNNQSGLLAAGMITDLAGNTLADIQSYAIPTVQDFVLVGAGGLAGPALTANAAMLGNHQLVLELRDATGQRVFQRINFGFTVVEAIDTLPAEVTADTTLSSSRAYLLDNRATFVRSGATLTIEPGVHILGSGIGALVIDRGARIMADGTRARPIVMTSAQPVGSRQTQDWGGLILNGRAPINTPGGVAEGEGDTGQYGGNDPADTSGVLRYVRVEFGGIEFSPDNELNGIALQGVGSGTIIDYVQVHFNKDDGIEFFGGTANARHVLLTSNADDNVDWTDGWTGKIQFVVVQQNSADADQGIEADNSAENNELEPRSGPTIYNVTLIGGNPAEGTQQESDIGILLREGTRATIRNAVVLGFGQQGLVIDHNSTVTQAQAGQIAVTNSLFFGNATREPNRGAFGRGSNVTSGFDVAGFITASANRNRVGINPGLRDPFNLLSPDYRPRLDSPLLDVNFVSQPPDDGFFTQVDFLGGVDPREDWTAGWTTTVPF